MGRLIAAAVLLALPAAPATAQSSALDQIRARLDAHAVVRAEFVQTRTMAALQRPQVSRGQLLVSRSEGAVWRMVEPYTVTYVLRQDSVVEIAADGTRTRRDAREAPAVARIGRIMSALVMADAAALGNDFQIEAGVTGERWHIALSPRQASIAQRLKSVRVSGREFVDSVEVEETGGDATQLQFRNHRGGANLSEDERRLFAGG
jgi:outer membrane lipoprotein-sorting protein